MNTNSWAIVAQAPAPVNPPARPRDPEPAPPTDDERDSNYGGWRCPGYGQSVVKLTRDLMRTQGLGWSAAMAQAAQTVRGGL